MFLLILCQDVVYDIVVNERRASPSTARKAALLNEVRKSLKTSKLWDSAIIPLLDFAKASACVSMDMAAVKIFALSFENEIKVCFSVFRTTRALNINQAL